MKLLFAYVLLHFGALCTNGVSWVKEMENSNLFEGDIVLDPDEREKGWNVSRHGQYASVRGGRWPGGVVPYEIQSSITFYGRRAIESAIENYQKYTCIRWKPRTNEQTYVSFYRGPGCSSPVGFRHLRVNTISLAAGCWHTGTTMHEMGHTLGLFHEQSRPDRDANVRILWQNIQAGMAYNFNRQTTRVVDSLGTPYDFGSMMHYGSTAFGVGGRMTIQTVDPKNQRIIGNRAGFSPIDVKQLNLMYKCGLSPTLAPPTPPPMPTEHQTEGPMTRPAVCDNQKVHCLAWASQGYCKGEFERYMNKYCCKSCLDLEKKKTGGATEAPTEAPTTASITETATKVTEGTHSTEVTAPTMLPALTSIPPPPECVNKFGFCNGWAKQGKCHGKFMKFMIRSCCKACSDMSKKSKTTHAPPKTEPKECTDEDSNCPSWAKNHATSVEGYKFSFRKVG